MEENDILSRLNGLDATARRDYARKLGNERNEDSVRILSHLLRDENKGVVDVALRSLTTIGGSEVLELALELLQGHDANLRSIAIDIIHSMDPSIISRSLIRFYQSSSGAKKKLAIELLGKLGADMALPHLFEALYDPDPNVQIAAAEALGLVESEVPSSILSEKLLNVLNSESNPWLRYAIFETLGLIGNEHDLHLIFQCLRYPLDVRGFIHAFMRRTGLEAILQFVANVEELYSGEKEGPPKEKYIWDGFPKPFPKLLRAVKYSLEESEGFLSDPINVELSRILKQLL